MKCLIAQLLWHSPRAIPIAAGFAVVTLIAVFWLYPQQVKPVKRPWRWMMPMLRTLALLTLAVALLQPATMRPRTVEQQGAVVVLLDRSKSMSIADAGRSPAERVALAAALALLPKGQREDSASYVAQLDQLRQLIDEARAARSELDYAKLAGRAGGAPENRLKDVIRRIRAVAGPLLAQAVAKPLADAVAALAEVPSDAQLVQLGKAVQETSVAFQTAQMASDAALYESDQAVRVAADSVDELSRAALGQRVLGGSGGILARLPRGTPVYSFAFDSDLAPTRPLADGGSTSNLPAAGQASNIVGAVRSVFERLGQHELQAVIVVSDGRQVGGDASSAALAMLGGVRAPVFAVDPTGPLPPDLSIKNVSLPQRAYVGETVNLRAEIVAHSLADGPVEVSVASADSKAGQTKQASLADGRATIDVPLKLGGPGIQPVRISVKALTNEASVENNTIERRIKVIADRLKVATVSPSPGWDFQYARNALSRAPGISLTDVTAGNLQSHPSFTPEAIRQHDVILLSDVHIDALTSSQWSALESLVTERGGSVIVLVNELSVIRQYEDDLRRSMLLPYRSETRSSWQVWPGRRPEFQLGAPREGDAISAATLDPAGDPAGLTWQQLPGFFRYLMVPELKAGVRTLLIERQRGTPMLTEARIGAGRVFFLGANETWRWRRGVGERFQDRFWLQLVRMASDEPYAVHQGALWVDVSPITPAPGDSIVVRARLGLERVEPGQDPLSVKLERGSDVVIDTTMRPVGSAGRFEAVIDSAPAAGRYELAVSNAQQTQSATTPLVIEPSDAGAEMVDLSGDAVMLRRIAEATGGRYVPITQVATVSEQLEQRRERQSTLAEYTLWDSPYLFAFVLACLGAEWALRKRFGLA